MIDTSAVVPEEFKPQGIERCKYIEDFMSLIKANCVIDEDKQNKLLAIAIKLTEDIAIFSNQCINEHIDAVEFKKVASNMLFRFAYMLTLYDMSLEDIVDIIMKTFNDAKEANEKEIVKTDDK